MRNRRRCTLVWIPAWAALSAPVAAVFPWQNTSLPRGDRVAALIAAMNVSERISQLGNAAPAIPRLGVPAYNWWSEALHGQAWAGIATVFPENIAIGASWDRDLAQTVAEAVAVELRAKYMNATAHTGNDSPAFFGLSVYTPNLNIFRGTTRCLRDLQGRGQETFGEDPVLAGALGAAFIRGLQFGDDDRYLKVIATAKHFSSYSLESIPGNPQYRLYIDYNVSDADMLQTYGLPFQYAVEHGNVSSVMCAYDAVNGVPMCLHPSLQQLLRDTYGFSGFVVSDLGAISYACSTHQYTSSVAEASALGLKAGTDLCLGGEYQEWLPECYANGTITLDDVDKALYRSLYARIQFGGFDPVADNPYNNVTILNVSTAAHRNLARVAALEGLVLLKNSGSFLPLSPDAVKTVALIGPSADYAQQLIGNYPGCTLGPGDPLMSDPLCHVVTIREMLSSAPYTFNLSYAAGCTINGNDTSGIPAAVAAAAGADVIIAALGLDTCQVGQSCSEGEANDRLYSLDFPGVQLQLMHALITSYPSTPIIVVLVNGGPVSSPSVFLNASVRAVLQAWYAGEEGGTAIGQAIFGDYSPAGRLPVTVVQGMSSLPSYIDYNMSATPGRTHRYYTGTPLAWFGQGLSYTTMAYSDLSVTPSAIPAAPSAVFNVSIRVQNTGAHTSDEVVQVYARYASGSGSSLPMHNLIGFTRVHDLGPGEAQTVTLSIPASALALFCASPTPSMCVQEGTYALCVSGQGCPQHPSMLFPATTALTATLTVMPAARAA